MDSEIISALIKTVGTVIVSIISGWVAFKVKEKELAKKGIGTSPPAKKPVVRWFWGIGGAALGAGLVVGILALTGNLGPSSAPSNLVEHFDFEQQPDKSLSLGVCDASSPSWWDNCHDDLNRLAWIKGGFTGKHSLSCRVELLPDRKQVYSIRLPITPPIIADALSANVYISDADQFSTINLAARIRGETEWKSSKFDVNVGGWSRVFLDLQQFCTQDGKPAGGSIIDEVHIDLYIPQSSQQPEETVVKIDDIELYFPLSQPVLSDAIKCSPDVSSVQELILTQKIGFEYQDSPFEHGWKIVQDEADETEIDFMSIFDDFVERAISISSLVKYGMDFEVGPEAAQSGKVVEFVVANFKGDAAIYALVSLERNDGATIDGWLKFKEGQEQPTRVSSDSDGEEWQLPVTPVSRRGGGWSLFRIDLEDAVSQTFGTEGWRFQNLTKFRIRGNLSVDQISVFETQP